MSRPKPSPEPKPKPTLSVFRVLRALAIGVLVFVLWAQLPRLMLVWHGIELPTQHQQALPEDPTYRNASGEIIQQPEHDTQLGHDQAKALGVNRHADCKVQFKGWMERGCHQWVTEAKHIPPHVQQGNWVGGKTTAQCLTEVDAHWSAVTLDMQEQGNAHAAEVWRYRSWAPERQECQNYDNVRITEVIYEPTERLQAWLQKVEHGSALTADEQAALKRDMALVSTYPDHAAKRAYLVKVDVLLQKLAQTSAQGGSQKLGAQTSP
jgi:hypothetical protein